MKRSITYKASISFLNGKLERNSGEKVEAFDKPLKNIFIPNVTAKHFSRSMRQN